MVDTNDVLHAFEDDEVRLARINYESQEWLTRELHSAFLMRGFSVRELADLLDLDVSTAEDWVSGNVDLSMSELRHLATALDAHVTYRVEPIVNRLPRWISALNDDAWAGSASGWMTPRAKA